MDTGNGSWSCKGWKALSERFGSLPFKKLLEPAIDYAKNGYPVSAEIARMWKKALNAIPNSEEFKAGMKLLLLMEKHQNQDR